eukprot:6253645-Pyramimonas_sp.AAC.1
MPKGEGEFQSKQRFPLLELLSDWYVGPGGRRTTRTRREDHIPKGLGTWCLLGATCQNATQE